MTKITANYPPEFKKIEYTAYWQDIEKQFTDLFGNLKEVTVNINVKIMSQGEQMDFYVEEQNDSLVVYVYFLRYFDKNKLTPVSSPSEFYSYIESVLNYISKKYKDLK